MRVIEASSRSWLIAALLVGVVGCANGGGGAYPTDSDASVDTGAHDAPIDVNAADGAVEGGADEDAPSDDAGADATTDAWVCSTAGCDDGDACTIDECNGEFGCSHTARDCDDGNACTTDACDPETGCSHTSIACDDGDACTVDSCDAELGCAHVERSCNDANACTTDACDPELGCVYTGVTCNDGSACTIDACDPLTGCTTTPVVCNDGSACTVDVCNPAMGCVTTPVSCDDLNACTAEACDPATGCSSTSISCDDMNACTADSCNPATGCAHTAIGCNDMNACTADSCNPATGCAFTAIACNDGNACTNDACDPATGCAYTPKSCDDGNACTADSCDTALGCQHTPIVGCVAPPAPPPGCSNIVKLVSTDTNVTIADLTTATSTVSVSGAGPVISDVVLTTRIVHPYAADLDIALIAPSGRRVTISTDNGGSASNAFNGTIWNDRATTPVTDATFTSGTPASTLVVEGALGGFVGEAANGTWTLEVRDDASPDPGYIDGFTLQVTTLSTVPTLSATTYIRTPLLSIPDDGVLFSFMTIPDTGVICDLNLVTYLAHEFSADLDVALVAPSGRTVTITTDNGGAAVDVFYGTTFDDHASTPVTDATYVSGSTTTPVTPEGALGAFAGESLAGTWMLEVADDLPFDTGALDQWELVVTTCSCP